MSAFSTEWLSRIKSAIKEAIDFRSRIWVIRISETRLKDESFIINEDSFQEPLQWMKRRKYSAVMLEQVEAMKLSQVLILSVGGQTHRLLRVK